MDRLTQASFLYHHSQFIKASRLFYLFREKYSDINLLHENKNTHIVLYITVCYMASVFTSCLCMCEHTCVSSDRVHLLVKGDRSVHACSENFPMNTTSRTERVRVVCVCKCFKRRVSLNTVYSVSCLCSSSSSSWRSSFFLLKSIRAVRFIQSVKRSTVNENQ